MTIRHLITLIVLMCSLVAPRSAADAANTRVAVMVTTEDGKPLQDVTLTAIVGGQRVIDTATKADGTAELKVDVPPGTEFIEIGHGFAHPSSFSSQEQVRLSKASESLVVSNHFDRAHRIAIKPDQSDYTLKIIAHPCVKVTATYVDGQHRPVSQALLFGHDHALLGSSDRGVLQPLRGLRKGVPNVIAARAFLDQYTIVKAFPLDERQMMDDVDLGEIVFTEPTDGVPISVQIAGAKEVQSIPKYLAGVTFVSSDGKLIVTFKTESATGAPQSAPAPLQAYKNQAPALPAGEYFVVPGYFFYNDDQAAVLQLLAKKVDLAKSDVPRITVRANDPNEFTVDLAKAHEAIQRLAETNNITP